jgi:hypothetical protein
MNIAENCDIELLATLPRGSLVADLLFGRNSLRVLEICVYILWNFPLDKKTNTIANTVALEKMQQVIYPCRLSLNCIHL